MAGQVGKECFLNPSIASRVSLTLYSLLEEKNKDAAEAAHRGGKGAARPRAAESAATARQRARRRARAGEAQGKPAST